MIHTIEIPKVHLEKIQIEWMKLLDAVSRGEEVIITRESEPVAKIVQVTEKHSGRLRYGSAKGLATMLPNFDDPIEGLEEYQ